MLETILPYFVTFTLGVLYYREIKRGKLASAILTEATTKKTAAEEESVSVATLEKVLQSLQSEYQRLAIKSNTLELAMDKLQLVQQELCNENKTLQDSMKQMREVISRLLAGVTLLCDQLKQVAPGVEPRFTVAEIQEILDAEVPFSGS